MSYVFVFIAMLVADVAWTNYFIQTGRGRAVAAGLWSAAIMAVSGFTTVSYVTDRYLIIPAILGSYLGTYLTIKWQKHKSASLNQF